MVQTLINTASCGISSDIHCLQKNLISIFLFTKGLIHAFTLMSESYAVQCYLFGLTNRESPAQFENRIKPWMYVRPITRRTMNLLAGTGVRKISSVVCGFSLIKIHFSDYPKSLIRENKLNLCVFLLLLLFFWIKYNYIDILLKKT